MQRLKVGMRCRIKKNSDWDEYVGHEILLERRNGKKFSFLVLREGKNIPLEKEKAGVVENWCSWITEDELEFVDSDFERNMDFIDWYQENEELFCPDCGAWYPKYGRIDPETDDYYPCPNEECPGQKGGECHV